MDDDVIDEGGHGRRGWARPRVRSGLGDDVDDATTARRTELHDARAEREEGVVLATADIIAGVEVGAPLAHDDLARADDLAAETLDAEPLSVGVPTVPGARCTLLVRHGVTSQP